MKHHNAKQFKHRVRIPFNTGTRIIKSKRDKALTRRVLNQINIEL